MSGMGKAEILLKVAMTPTDNQKKFVEQYVTLMPDTADVQEFHRVLEMKGAKRSEVSILTCCQGGGLGVIEGSEFCFLSMI